MLPPFTSRLNTPSTSRLIAPFTLRLIAPFTSRLIAASTLRVNIVSTLWVNIASTLLVNIASFIMFLANIVKNMIQVPQIKLGKICKCSRHALKGHWRIAQGSSVGMVEAKMYALKGH